MNDDARHAEPAPERGTSSNQKRLEEIALRLKAATPGPWRITDFAEAFLEPFARVTIDAKENGGFCEVDVYKRDAAFIANAPSDLEWCIDYIRDLEGREAKLRELHVCIMDKNDLGFCGGCMEAWPCKTIVTIGGRLGALAPGLAASPGDFDPDTSPALARTNEFEERFQRRGAAIAMRFLFPKEQV